MGSKCCVIFGGGHAESSTLSNERIIISSGQVVAYTYTRVLFMH